MVTMVDHQAEWKVTAATALGSRHSRTGRPNQDAHLSKLIRVGENELTVIAISDGHGGQRYVRSDVGSQLAVATFVRTSEKLLAQRAFPSSSQGLERFGREVLAPALVEQWRDAVMAHLHDQAFTDAERGIAEDPLDQEPLIAYGATLVAAILGRDSVLVLQIGDGDCLFVGDGGTVETPVPGDSRLVGGETTSLCLPTAVNDARVVAVDRNIPRLVVLATDGYGVAFASPDWRQTLGRDLLEQVRALDETELAQALPVWIGESARVGGDDVTVVMASNSRQSPKEVVGMAPRQTRWLIAALVSLLVGIGAGWALARLERGAPTPGSTVSTATTTLETATTTELPTTTASPEPSPPTTTPPSTPEPSVSTTTNVISPTPVPSRNWIVAAGWVIEFSEDPVNPKPQRVEQTTMESITELWVGEQKWTIRNGDLFFGEEAAEFPDERAGAMLLAGGHVWLWVEGPERGQLCPILVETEKAPQCFPVDGEQDQVP